MQLEMIGNDISKLRGDVGLLHPVKYRLAEPISIAWKSGSHCHGSAP
jgi:hypothetical protein